MQRHRFPASQIAHFRFGRVGIAVQQRLGGDQEARCADAALQGRVVEELLLQGMQPFAFGDAFDGVDFAALRLGAEHQAGTTSRPSRVTLQAPQSPLPQPSLLPVRPSRSRSTSSRVSSGSQRYSTGSPLIVVETWICDMSSPFRALMRNVCCPGGEHAGNLGAEFYGAALVVDRTAGSGCRRRHGVERVIAKIGADQGARGLVDQQHDLGHRAQGNARIGAGAVGLRVRLTPAPTTAMSISVRGMKRR